MNTIIFSFVIIFWVFIVILIATPAEFRPHYQALRDDEKEQILDTIQEMIIEYPITVDEILKTVKKAARKKVIGIKLLEN